MKIVSWNCRYGFTEEKVKAIKDFNADILVIQECREIDMDKTGYDKDHRDWYGDHKEVDEEKLTGDFRVERDLGVGIFWKNGITINQNDEWRNSLKDNCDFRYIIPYEVKGNFYPFTLFAVWTKNRGGMNDRLDYIRKAHAAFDEYKCTGLLDDQVIMIGDFNSNPRWNDDYQKDWNHTAFVEKLNKNGIIDCSHSSKKKDYFTYYYYTKDGIQYVIDDYCFASLKIANAAEFFNPDFDDLLNLETGQKRWRDLSDHCPISVKFDL